MNRAHEEFWILELLAPQSIRHGLRLSNLNSNLKYSKSGLSGGKS
jgi:hypothetical protein